MNLVITPERADNADAIALIEELETVLGGLYAEESRHGYSVEKLIREGVYFFVARANGEPAACGGIRYYEDFGEVKRMYVRDAFRGRGIGHAMLERLAEHARLRGCKLLRLETGVYQHEAIRLYERWGFERIEAFPPYRPDPVSIFYEKRID